MSGTAIAKVRHCFFCDGERGFSRGDICTGCGTHNEQNREAIKQDRRYETRMVRHPCDRCTSSWAMKESDELVVCMGCGTKVVREKKLRDKGTDKSCCERCGGKLLPGVAQCVYCGFGDEGVDDE